MRVLVVVEGGTLGTRVEKGAGNVTSERSIYIVLRDTE